MIIVLALPLSIYYPQHKEWDVMGTTTRKIKKVEQHVSTFYSDEWDSTCTKSIGSGALV